MRRLKVSNSESLLCIVCDVPDTSKKLNRKTISVSNDEIKSFYRVLSLLSSLQSIRNSRRLRTFFARVVRRFAEHASDASYLALSSDTLGEWSMKCIQSSSRELRMAAS